MMNMNFPKIGEIICNYKFKKIILDHETRKVYLASSLKSKNSKEVVVKVIFMSEEEEKYTESETQILKQLDSPNIIKLIDSFDYNGFRFLVTPKIKDGDSYELAGKYDENFVKEIVFNVLNALSTLHSNNIVHRDIKPENIFLDILEKDTAIKSNNNSKFVKAILGDFGLAIKFGNSNELSDDSVGTLPFCSPQIIGHRQCMF